MKTWNGFEKGINLGGWLSQWDLTDREHLETFITGHSEYSGNGC